MRPELQSLIQLISNPERFEGKPVRVVAYVVSEFEGDSLYLHQEDYEQALYKNGLWLADIEKCKDPKGIRINKRYALVEGTFTAQTRGHRSMWSGTLTVDRCIASRSTPDQDRS